MEDTSEAAKGGLFSGSRSTAVETPRTAAPEEDAQQIKSQGRSSQVVE